MMDGFLKALVILCAIVVGVIAAIWTVVGLEALGVL